MSTRLAVQWAPLRVFERVSGVMVEGRIDEAEDRTLRACTLMSAADSGQVVQRQLTDFGCLRLVDLTADSATELMPNSKVPPFCAGGGGMT